MGIAITADDDDDEQHQQQASERIVVKVKTLSEKPIRVEILPSATVGELKELVKKQAGAEGKFLRLIHQGKMLSDDKATLESCRVKSEDFIHCAISAAPPKAVVSQVQTTLLQLCIAYCASHAHAAGAGCVDGHRREPGLGPGGHEPARLRQTA